MVTCFAKQALKLIWYSRNLSWSDLKLHSSLTTFRQMGNWLLKGSKFEMQRRGFTEYFSFLIWFVLRENGENGHSVCLFSRFFELGFSEHKIFEKFYIFSYSQKLNHEGVIFQFMACWIIFQLHISLWYNCLEKKNFQKYEGKLLEFFMVLSLKLLCSFHKEKGKIFNYFLAVTSSFFVRLQAVAHCTKLLMFYYRNDLGDICSLCAHQP